MNCLETIYGNITTMVPNEALKQPANAVTALALNAGGRGTPPAREKQGMRRATHCAAKRER